MHSSYTILYNCYFLSMTVVFGKCIIVYLRCVNKRNMRKLYSYVIIKLCYMAFSGSYGTLRKEKEI